MLDFIFGWKDESKCKKLIKKARKRIKFLRIKREAIIKVLREDLSRLVEKGYLQIATKRAEQLIADESAMKVYDLLSCCCKIVEENMSVIRRRSFTNHGELPFTVIIAVSSIIFASARCGELPELRRIRELFKERYGERFALVAVDLLPRNVVHSEIIELLSMKSVSDECKLRVAKEVVRRGLGIQPENPSIEHPSELHKKNEDKAEQQSVSLKVVPISPVIVADSKQKDIGMTQVEKKAAVVDSVGAGIDQLQTMQSTPEVDHLAIQCSQGKKGSEQMEGTLSSSSPESSPLLTYQRVANLDDVEEVESSPKPDVEDFDQRLFKFKQPVSPTVEVTDDRSPRSSRRRQVPSGKRFRRSVSREPQSTADVEYATYYCNAPPENYPGRTYNVSSARRESHCNCCVCRKKARDQDVLAARPRRSEEGFRRQPQVLPDDSSDSNASSTEDNALLPSYVRAMTMPPKRQTEVNNIPRSNSCPFGHPPSHVHPKLPDYDQLAEKFSALKKEFALLEQGLTNMSEGSRSVL